MGAAALRSARSILSIAISHNMDNVAEISQTDIEKYFGLTAGGPNGAGTDASGSKTMLVDQNNDQITYTYTRGGVVVTGIINYADQSTTWTVNGMGTIGNPPTNRQTAIAEGLKVPVTGGNLTFT